MEFDVLAEWIKILGAVLKRYQPICRIWLGSFLTVNIWQPEHAEVSEPLSKRLQLQELSEPVPEPHKLPGGK